MRKLILAIGLMILGAMAHSALQPMSALAQQATPARGVTQTVTTQPIPPCPAPKNDSCVDADDIAPLLKTVMDLDAQRVAIAREEFGNDGHGGKMLDLHLMEQKVAVRMGVDMSTHRFSRDGKSVEEAQGVPQVGRGR